MVATSLTTGDPDLDEANTFPLPKAPHERLLKLWAVYGANASGKSNLISALRFMRTFVRDSSKSTQSDDPIGVEPFLLNPTTPKQPSHFEVVFVDAGVPYRYGFEATAQSVVAEWLFSAPRGKEAKLFTREGNSISVNQRTFREGSGLEEKTRKNALFLSVVAQFNGKSATRVLRWFRRLGIISAASDDGYMGYTLKQCLNDSHRDYILNLLRRFDTGIDDLSANKQPMAESLPKDFPAPLREFLLGQPNQDIVEMKTHHGVYDDAGERVGTQLFELQKHESEGTKKLFALSGPILDTLTAPSGRVLVIDELDARLHPLLTRAIIRLFRSPKTNPNNAQLLFSTHDVNLLRRGTFRRDQVWFASKSRTGETQLAALSDYKGLRNTAQFDNEYVDGRFGGVPVIRDVDSVIEVARAETQLVTEE